MKKYIFYIVYIIICGFQLYSDNFNLKGVEILSPFPSPYSLMLSSSENLILSWYDTDSSLENWDFNRSYKYSISDKFPTFINLDENISKSILDSLELEKNIEFGNKILLLSGQIPSLEKNDYTGEEFFPIISVGYATLNNKPEIFLLDIPWFESLGRVYESASSELTEGQKHYTIDNLDNLDLETSWVEGVEGYGIGESFIIKNLWGDIYNHLLIVNGFISFKYPNLYYDNGRIKKIKIEGLVSGVSIVRSVLDTPHFQTVDISAIKESEDLKVTILEVYEGRKYKDTAIHYMITYDNNVLPLRE